MYLMRNLFAISVWHQQRLLHQHRPLCSRLPSRSPCPVCRGHTALQPYHSCIHWKKLLFWFLLLCRASLGRICILLPWFINKYLLMSQSQWTKNWQRLTQIKAQRSGGTVNTATQGLCSTTVPTVSPTYSVLFKRKLEKQSLNPKGMGKVRRNRVWHCNSLAGWSLAMHGSPSLLSEGVILGHSHKGLVAFGCLSEVQAYNLLLILQYNSVLFAISHLTLQCQIYTILQ